MGELVAPLYYHHQQSHRLLKKAEKRENAYSAQDFLNYGNLIVLEFV